MTNSTKAGIHPPTFSLRRLGLIGSVAFFALFVLLWSAAPAHANLAAVGPVSERGYPAWYEDSNGLRLDLCLDDPFCLGVSDGEPTGLGAAGEAFYWLAETSMTTSGGLALIVMGTEATLEVPNTETVFNRIRLRINVSQPGTYTVKYPYGQQTFDVASIGVGFEINVSADIGCIDDDLSAAVGCNDGVAPDFSAALVGTEVGPWLRWDPAVAPLAPAGYVGDPAVEHRVVGSPIIDAGGNPQNYWRIEGPGINPNGSNSIETRQFAVQGRMIAGPTRPDLDPLSDSGASQVDNITNVRTPTFTGSATAGNTVNIYDGATLIGSTVAASPSGLYSFAVPAAGAFAEGLHAISATELDALGTESEHSAALNMTVDATAPAAPALPDLLAASDTGSSSTDNITNDTTPTFTGTAAANMTVNILVDGVSRGSAAASAAGSYSITTSALSDGVKSIRATATDVAGNVGASPANALQVTIDTLAPAVPSGPDLPAGADSGLSSSDNVTNQGSLTLVGSAEAGTAVKVMVDGVLLSTVAAGGDGSYAINLADVGEGALEVAVLALDAAGNESGPSGALGILIDSTAPTAPGLAALSPFSLSRSINLEWSASSEGGSGLAGYSLSYQRAAVRGPAGGSIEWANGLAATSAVFSGVPGSSYCFTVGATDKAGNSSAASFQQCTAVPLDDRTLVARGGGWARKLGPGHFLGTFTKGAKRGAQLVLNGIQTKRLAVLVTTCPGCGTLKAYWNGVAVKTIDLDTRAVRKMRLVSVKSFPEVRTGNLSLRIVSPTGERVIVDGVASSPM